MHITLEYSILARASQPPEFFFVTLQPYHVSKKSPRTKCLYMWCDVMVQIQLFIKTKKKQNGEPDPLEKPAEQDPGA